MRPLIDCWQKITRLTLSAITAAPKKSTDGIAIRSIAAVFIDSNINEGELYAFGNRVAVCIRRPTETFEPNEQDMDYRFRLLDDGSTTLRERRDPGNENTMVQHWDDGAYQLQRFQDAVIANNQTCDCTEIGIGSTVWKRLSGSNINNFPENVIWGGTNQAWI